MCKLGRFSKLLEKGKGCILSDCARVLSGIEAYFSLCLQALEKQADGNSELVFSCKTVNLCVCIHLVFIEIILVF